MPGEIEVNPGVSAIPAVESAAPAVSETTVSDTSFLIPDEVMSSSDLDEIEVPAAQAAEKTEPEVPAATPAKPAEATPAVPAAAAKPATPAKPGEAKPADAAKPAETAKPPETAARPTVTADRSVLLNEVAKNRDQIISHLAGDRFKLSKEESDLLDTDATAGIQRIAARVYYEATTSTLNLIDRFVKQELPNLITQQAQTTQVHSEAESEFAKAWPNLDMKVDGQVINQYANIFRQANPTASRADAIKAVGAIVSTILNKPLAPAAPAVPAKPAVRSFSPASGTARVVSQVAVPSENPFEGLGREFE